MEVAALYEIFKQHPNVTTDSRICPEGSIFWALKGESFNGNDFAAKALEAGCAYAVVDEPGAADLSDERYLLVDDTLKALQELANYHRRQFHIPVLQITGTNGKTTTKELIAAVLERKYQVLFTQGNLNNHIGVPRTLLRLNDSHEIAVIETGANQPGEIEFLTNIVEPDYGLITNVGMAHLAGFGSFEGVMRTKGELYDYLRNTGKPAFIHVPDENLQKMAAGLSLIPYATELTTEDVPQGELVGCDPFLTFRWKYQGDEFVVRTHLVGSYNLANMMAAVAVGLKFGVEPQDICAALTEYVPSNNRSQMQDTADNHLVVDAYNANPTSMKAAIENFRLMQNTPKMLILGEMKELGETSAVEHQKIVEQLLQAGLENVWLVGAEFEQTRNPFRTFHHVDDVVKELKQNKPEGYYILIKGSNGTRLFTLPEYL